MHLQPRARVQVRRFSIVALKAAAAAEGRAHNHSEVTAIMSFARILQSTIGRVRRLSLVEQGQLPFRDAATIGPDWRTIVATIATKWNLFLDIAACRI
jgi:hypothetical protein